MSQPDAISISGVISNYNGFGVSAKNASNGSINATVAGGYLVMDPIMFILGQGQMGLHPIMKICNLSALTVTDDNDCTKTIQFVLQSQIY